jgi:ABC-type polysaccharide/polyol phosphate export permease
MAAPTAIRPPLGLPWGSIRALLTLLIVAVVIAQLVRGQEVEVPHLMRNITLGLVLFYFGSR